MQPWLAWYPASPPDNPPASASSMGLQVCTSYPVTSVDATTNLI